MSSIKIEGRFGRVDNNRRNVENKIRQYKKQDTFQTQRQPVQVKLAHHCRVQIQGQGKQPFLNYHKRKFQANEEKIRKLF